MIAKSYFRHLILFICAWLVGLTSIIMITFQLSLSDFSLSAVPSFACERKYISQRSSSDGRWIAVIQQEMCADVSITTLTDQVQIKRSGSQSSTASVVLSIDSYEYNRLRLEWVSSTLLEITIPNRSLIGVQKDKYDDVRITIKYDPDDPADRMKFLKKVGN